MGVGRKRKPDEAKVLQGTFRSDRANPDAPAPAPETAKPPAHLSAPQKRIFLDLVAQLEPNKLASATYTQMLALAAIQLAHVERCNRVIASKGATYKTRNTTGGTVYKARPEVGQLQEHSRHAQSLLVEFGLSAASRGKVSAGKKPPAGNQFGNLT